MQTGFSNQLFILVLDNNVSFGMHSIILRGFFFFIFVIGWPLLHHKKQANNDLDEKSLRGLFVWVSHPDTPAAIGILAVYQPLQGQG